MISLILTLLQVTGAMRPTIQAMPSDPPRRNVSILFYDDRFLFAARDHGDARDFGGTTEPGLFVHSKARDRWLQITAISTAGGSFGTSTSSDPEAAMKLRKSPVGWDFREAGRQPYLEQPLRTSGSITFPDRIEYDRASNRYVLRYFSSWGVASAEVILYVGREDLDATLRKDGT